MQYELFSWQPVPDGPTVYVATARDESGVLVNWQLVPRELVPDLERLRDTPVDDWGKTAIELLTRAQPVQVLYPADPTLAAIYALAAIAGPSESAAFDLVAELYQMLRER